MRDLTPMRFARDYVARNKPVIIEGELRPRRNKCACSTMQAATRHACRLAPLPSCPWPTPCGTKVPCPPHTHRRTRTRMGTRTGTRTPLYWTLCTCGTCGMHMRHAGALDDWPALALWRSEYLAQVTGGLQVSVAITPGGRADAITHVPLPSQPLPSQQLPSDKHRHRRASPATSDCGGSRRGASGAVTAGSGQGGDGDNGGGDGYGGAQQAQRWFLTPHTQRMSLAQFFALARHSRAQGSSYAPYVQVCSRRPHVEGGRGWAGASRRECAECMHACASLHGCSHRPYTLYPTPYGPAACIGVWPQRGGHCADGDGWSAPNTATGERSAACRSQCVVCRAVLACALPCSIRTAT